VAFSVKIESMDFSFTDEDEAFRDELRDWQRRLNEGRWGAINWPLAWNGREATPLQDAVYSEEMARVQALAASGIDSTFLRNGRSRETFLSTGGCAAGGSRGSGLGFGTSGARAGTR